MTQIGRGIVQDHAAGTAYSGTRVTPAAERPVGAARRGVRMKALNQGSHPHASPCRTAAASPRVARVPQRPGNPVNLVNLRIIGRRASLRQ